MQANGDVAAGVRFPPTLGVRRLPMRPPILRTRCSSNSSKFGFTAVLRSCGNDEAGRDVFQFIEGNVPSDLAIYNDRQSLQQGLPQRCPTARNHPVGRRPRSQGSLPKQFVGIATGDREGGWPFK